MKYIRTRDGIYEFKEEYMSISKGIYYLFGKLEETSEDYLFKNDLSLGKFIKQADTIEELCDGFAIKEKNYIIQVFLKKDGWTLEEVIKQPRIIGTDIVGYIETEKGLIYVAKMNKKGKLELL